jgi:hypothetical protein
MKNKKLTIIETQTIFREILMMVCILPVLLTFAGCLNGYGVIKADLKVNSQFESKTILPDHLYYYNGRKSIPYAIVGIHKDYVLNTFGWSAIEPVSSELPKMIEKMYQSGFDMPQGSTIFDHQGHPIGVWFSLWRQTAVKMQGENNVTINSPYNPNRVSEFPRF